MAGSYKHIVDDEGKLLDIYGVSVMNENMGDVFETIEEMYGMIWYLSRLVTGPDNMAHIVERARLNYKVGLEISPGTDGQLPKEE